MVTARPFRPIVEEAIADLQRWYPEERAAPEEDTFEIGLTLAGGQSAGCYIAGVMDFLFQALDCWHEARLSAPDSTPNHKVKLKVIVGASAGGLNAAIAAVAAACRFRHATHHRFEERERNWGSPFYRAWVRDIDISHLLATDDLDRPDGPVSLLNGAYLDKKVDDFIGFGGDGPADPEVRAWLEDPLPVKITVGNLDGVSYAVRFTAERADQATASAHRMTMHEDYLAFLRPIFAPPAEPAVPDHELLSMKNRTDDPPWQRLGKAGLATVAFPLALAERAILRPSTDYEYRFAFPFATRLVFAQPFPGQQARQVEFMAIDGGIVDNEPFKLAHDVLVGTKGTNERDGGTAKRAIILVDPFVSPPAERDGRSTPILGLVNKIWQALVSQARFKPIDLALAESEAVYSRYMIAPVRNTTKGKIRGDDALASHPVSAFLGYFCEHYRHHDFMLGRHNCYKFLRDWLVLPSTHAREGEDGAGHGNSLFAKWPQAALDNPRFLSRSEHRPDHRQIVPLLGEAAVEPELSDWPAGQYDGYPAVERQAKTRLQRLYRHWRRELAESLSETWLRRRWTLLVITLVWRFGLRRRILRALQGAIDKGRDEIDGAPPSRPEPAVQAPDKLIS